MKAIYRLYKKIYRTIANYITLIMIHVNAQKKCKKIFLIGVPIHGNIGDQAILVAEKKFLKEKLANYQIISIPSILINKHIKQIKKIINKEDKICVHGGGFLGNLWLNEEKMFRKTIESFPQNNIIVLPQTIFFTDNVEGMNEYKVSREIYEKHKKLVFFLREQFSYEYMKESFKNCKVNLVPDIVLYLKKHKKAKKNNEIILCLRNDKEKTLTNTSKLISSIKKIDSIKIRITDMIVKSEIFTDFFRKRIVDRKIKQFSKAKLVITDRLHGMIFSYLADTPCIVMNSQSHKVKGVYKWLEKDSSIVFLDSEEVLINNVKKILNSTITSENIDFSKKYDEIIKAIEES